MRKKDGKKSSVVEMIGKRIPDPVIIFIILYVVTFLLSVFWGGLTFGESVVGGETIKYSINNMAEAENVRWIFDNALLANWLAYGGGVLGLILIVMFGVGIAEDSGLLATLIKKISMKCSDKWLPILLVFLGIMSSVASDAGYIILIPLAGLLYAGIKKNPLIGMAAAFAGVSAGFSANLIPATPIDVIVGSNAEIFAAAQGVPFMSSRGTPLSVPYMNYYFIVVSTIVLSIVGAWVTIKIVAPKLEKQSFIIPDDLDLEEFTVKPEENIGLISAVVGLVFGIVIIVALYFGPLAPYADVNGKMITPFTNNIILMITIVFFMPGLFYGVAIKKYNNSQAIVMGLARQISNMGYVIVLTFFCYNFLALLTKSNIGTYITYLGATFLENLGFGEWPMLLIIGFILTTAVINLFVGGLSSKWLLLGPIFIPMLYRVHPEMTPDMVAAAFRVADSSTNIITPMMSYTGVILAYMRKYKPEFTLGNLIGVMFPYSVVFLIVWTILLLIFFQLGLPLGPAGV
ncbi:AbgT family transporter [Candidatus Epulonipiscium viviparus]|uniref:AbgT family transporter n=1 Tax=Candidatus Epulonipiscium viviparus TaxID=420336 RepID=UPI002738041E|nr:AbgT family transporter [Candidatus Epulopiscium viviparus]